MKLSKEVLQSSIYTICARIFLDMLHHHSPLNLSFNAKNVLDVLGKLKITAVSTGWVI